VAQRCTANIVSSPPPDGAVRSQVAGGRGPSEAAGWGSPAAAPLPPQMPPHDGLSFRGFAVVPLQDLSSKGEGHPGFATPPHGGSPVKAHSEEPRSTSTSGAEDRHGLSPSHPTNSQTPPNSSPPTEAEQGKDPLWIYDERSCQEPVAVDLGQLLRPFARGSPELAPTTRLQIEPAVMHQIELSTSPELLPAAQHGSWSPSPEKRLKAPLIPLRDPESPISWSPPSDKEMDCPSVDPSPVGSPTVGPDNDQSRRVNKVRSDPREAGFQTSVMESRSQQAWAQDVNKTNEFDLPTEGDWARRSFCGSSGGSRGCRACIIN